MNPTDISELRRRLNVEKAKGGKIYGIYATDSGEIISEFNLLPAAMAQSVSERYMAIFRKLLSGTMGVNLRTLDYTSSQVTEGEYHPALMDALTTRLEEEEARSLLVNRVLMAIQEEAAEQAQSVEKKQAAPNWLLLLWHDGYDRPAPGAEDDAEKGAGSVFHYLMAALCPVKQQSPGLSYSLDDGDFRLKNPDWIASMPEAGFVFPVLEEGGANIWRVLYYTRTAEHAHPALLKNVLGMEAEMSPEEQKETFNTLLAETLAGDCTLDTVQSVHETITDMIVQTKNDKTAEPLKLSHEDMKRVLEESGVNPEKAERFSERCQECFGETEIPAVNVVSPRQFKVDAPGVSIRVSPDMSSLLETRMIDGRPYILVPVDGDVEVNGMKITGITE